MPHERGSWAHRVHARRRFTTTNHWSEGFAPTAFGLLIGLLPAMALADEPTISLPSITVSGSSAAGEAIRREAVAPTVTVTREEFDTLPNDRVSDIVARMPGVIVSGPPGEKKAFSLRGLPTDYTRVSVDGIQLPAPSRSFELMNMSSFLAGEVTLLRNPSAEHDAEGIAGRIAVTTRTIPVEPTGELRVGYGGLDGLNGTAKAVGGAYGQRIDRFGLLGSVSYEERRLSKVKDNSEFTFSGGPGGQGFRRDEEEPKDVGNFDAALDLASFYDGGEIHLKPMLLRETSDLDKWRDQYRRVTGQYQDRVLTSGREEATNVGATLDHTHRFDGGVSLRSFFNLSTAAYDTRNRETTLTPAQAFASATESESDFDERTGQFGSTVTVPMAQGVPQVLKAGVVIRAAKRTSDGESHTLNAAGTRSQTNANRLTSRQSDYEIEERYYAAFFQDEVTLGALTLTPGVRVERVTDQMTGYNGRFDVDATDLFPSLPLRYRLNDEIVLRGAVSRQINRPKFEDMAPGITVRGPRTIYGNPDVEPTRSWSVDAGAEYHGDGFFLAANLFHRRVRDVIEADEVNTNTLVIRNVGDGYARGLELEQRFNLGLLGIAALRPLTFFANQTFLKTEVNDPNTGTRPFAETPDLTVNLGLTWNDPDTGTILSATVNASGERLVISNEGSGQIRRKTRKSEAFIDLYAEQHIAEGFSLFASVENLTDKSRSEYEVTNGTLSRDAEIATGRTVLVGGRLRF
jgi:outer membrane receptor protein involved in Fe transport